MTLPGMVGASAPRAAIDFYPRLFGWTEPRLIRLRDGNIQPFDLFTRKITFPMFTVAIWWWETRYHYWQTSRQKSILMDVFGRGFFERIYGTLVECLFLATPHRSFCLPSPSANNSSSSICIGESEWSTPHYAVKPRSHRFVSGTFHRFWSTRSIANLRWSDFLSSTWSTPAKSILADANISIRALA